MYIYIDKLTSRLLERIGLRADSLKTIFNSNNKVRVHTLSVFNFTSSTELKSSSPFKCNMCRAMCEAVL